MSDALNAAALATLSAPDFSPLKLNAEGLINKWGFGDGDAIASWAESALSVPPDVGHAALILLVREQLGERLASLGVKTYTLNTMHNPVRAEGYHAGDPEPEYADALRAISVEVPGSVVVDALIRGTVDLLPRPDSMLAHAVSEDGLSLTLTFAEELEFEERTALDWVIGLSRVRQLQPSRTEYTYRGDRDRVARIAAGLAAGRGLVPLPPREG